MRTGFILFYLRFLMNRLKCNENFWVGGQWVTSYRWESKIVQQNNYHPIFIDKKWSLFIPAGEQTYTHRWGWIPKKRKCILNRYELFVYVLCNLYWLSRHALFIPIPLSQISYSKSEIEKFVQYLNENRGNEWISRHTNILNSFVYEFGIDSRGSK